MLSVAAMAYGSCQDAASAPTPAGTITVISWPVFGARTRRCEPGPAPCGQITGNVAGGGAAAVEILLRCTVSFALSARPSGYERYSAGREMFGGGLCTAASSTRFATLQAVVRYY